MASDSYDHGRAMSTPQMNFATPVSSGSESYEEEAMSTNSSLRVSFPGERSSQWPPQDLHQRSLEYVGESRNFLPQTHLPPQTPEPSGFSAYDSPGGHPSSGGSGSYGEAQHLDRSWFSPSQRNESNFDSSNILLKRRKAEQGNSKDHPVLPPCNCSRLRCSEKMTEAEREKINATYWGLKSLTKRRQWMLDHMNRQLIDMSHKKWLGKKSESRTFFFPDQTGELFRVCKDFFLRTLGFQCDSTLKALSYSTPLTSNVASADQRGRKHKSQLLKPEIRDLVKKHIHTKLDNSQFKAEFNSLRSQNGCGFVQVCFNDFQSMFPDQTDVDYQAYQDIFVEQSKGMAKAGSLKSPHTDLMLLKEAYYDYQNQMYGESYGDVAGNSSAGADTSYEANLSQGSRNARDFLAYYQKEMAQFGNEYSENQSALPFNNGGKSDASKMMSSSGGQDQLPGQSDGGLSFPSGGDKAAFSQNTVDVESLAIAMNAQFSENNVSSGKLASKRRKDEHPMKPGCDCKRKCYSKIDEERRLELHNMFWSMPDYAKQEQWILKQRVLVRHTTVSRDPRHTKEIQCYFLPDKDGKQTRICRHHFMSTLGFSMDSGKPSGQGNFSGVMPLRKRELNRTSAMEQHIQGFIHSGKSIPGLKREDSNNPWDQRVTIKEMHQDFLRLFPFLAGSYGTYYKLYNEQLNAFKADLFSGSRSFESQNQPPLSQSHD